MPTNIHKQQNTKGSRDPREKFPRPGNTEKPQSYPGLEHAMVTKPDYGKDTYQGSGRLKGKAALITGGDSGIGRAVALAFAREGADVMITYLKEEEKDAEEILADIRECGVKGIGVPGDLSSEEFCAELMRQAHDQLGHVDVLVNNAALQKCFKSFEEMRGSDFAGIYQINVIAPFLLSKAAAEHMRPGSSIINTVSIQAYAPSSHLLPYAASKGAFVALTKGLAEELLTLGIRVNAVAPGPIWSPLNTHGAPVEKLKRFGEQSAFGRPGQPVEVSPIYVFLASEDASYINGEIYGVTGGERIA